MSAVEKDLELEAPLDKVIYAKRKRNPFIVGRCARDWDIEERRGQMEKNERLTNGDGRRADRISKRRFATSRAAIVREREEEEGGDDWPKLW